MSWASSLAAWIDWLSTIFIDSGEVVILRWPKGIMTRYIVVEAVIIMIKFTYTFPIYLITTGPSIGYFS